MPENAYVPIRRREHEADAMAYEIARLDGCQLSPLVGDANKAVAAAAAEAGGPGVSPSFIVVLVIAAAPAPGTSAGVTSALAVVLDDLKKAVLALGHIGGRAIELIEDATKAEDKPVEKNVVLLTAGILVAGSASLSAFAAVAQAEATDRADRLVLVYLPAGSSLDDKAA